MFYAEKLHFVSCYNFFGDLVIVLKMRKWLKAFDKT